MLSDKPEDNIRECIFFLEYISVLHFTISRQDTHKTSHLKKNKKTDEEDDSLNKNLRHESVKIHGLLGILY